MSSRTINPYIGDAKFQRPEVVSMPLVSVVVVTYRDREELGRLLDDLARFRADGRVEVVIVDGGSDDGSVELLRARAGDLDCWISEPDAGIYDAMNKGVALARGRYVIHINAGDRLLAIPWEHLPDREDGPAWVSCQVREDHGIFQPRLSWVSWYANTNNHQGSFFRRDMHLGYRPEYRVYGDFEHHLRLLCAGVRPTLVRELVAEHRGGGASADTRWNVEEARAVEENLGRVHALLPKFMVPVRRYRDRFSLTAGIRSAIVNIGWLSSDRIVRLGGALLVGTVVARYLGPARFGLLNLALAIYMLFNTASNLGLDFLIVRDVVLDPENHHSILGTAFLLKVAASVLTTMFATVFALVTHPHQPELVVMVALLSAAAISQGLDVIDYFFQAKLLSRHTVAPKLVSFVIVNLLRLWAVYKHAQLMTFVELAALDVVAGELALLLSYWRFPHGLPRWSFDMSRGRKLLTESWPMVVASVLVMVYMRTDQILLGYFLGDRAVGYYSAAVRLSEIWYMIPAIICSTVMPKLLTLLESDKVLYYRRLQQLYNYFVLASVGLALVTIPTSRWLIHLVFGGAYLPAAPILNVHVWTGVFVFIGVLGGQQLIHEKLIVVEMQRALMGAVVNLVLNLLLIRRFGVVGSAVATLVAQATASYLSDAFSGRTRHLFRMKTRALSGFWIRGEFRPG